jgi:hypothetical protein
MKHVISVRQTLGGYVWYDGVVRAPHYRIAEVSEEARERLREREGPRSNQGSLKYWWNRGAVQAS